MTAHNPFKQNNNNKKPNKQNENTKQKEMQTKTKQTEQNKNKIHGDIRKTLLTLNVTYECYSWNAAYSLN